MKPKVSIIIVKYKSKKYLSRCLKSIGKSPFWEVIIVDNDQKNIGFGPACNQGARHAKGKFLFFLNPDTLVLNKALEQLVKFLETHPDFALIAPLLLDENKQPYPFQGTDKLTPFSAAFSLSILNKLMPHHPISKKYWLRDWNKKDFQETAVVPGSAFMMRKKVFKEVNGFDESFFLYFEEIDLCKRVKDKGWRIGIFPKAKVIHFWGQSTPKNKRIKREFIHSRFYYFKKNYGLMKALLVEFFLRGGEWLAPLF